MYRISELIKLNKKILHTNDLAILWGISNKNTLYKTISRYSDKGVLFPIYKGFYSAVPIDELDPLELGRAIAHRYTYLTTETVLVEAGVIYQNIHAYTFAADLSKHITINRWYFRFRKLKDVYLFNPMGIIEKSGNFVATLERAVADMLYYNPNYHFDNLEVIDFEKVQALQEQIGYPC